MTLEQVLDEAKRLPDSDKWRLVRHLLDDLSEDAADPTKEELLAGLKRSFAQITAGEYRPARDFLDELDRETGQDADHR